MEAFVAGSRESKGTLADISETLSGETVKVTSRPVKATHQPKPGST